MNKTFIFLLVSLFVSHTSQCENTEKPFLQKALECFIAPEVHLADPGELTLAKQAYDDWVLPTPSKSLIAALIILYLCSAVVAEIDQDQVLEIYDNTKLAISNLDCKENVLSFINNLNVLEDRAATKHMIDRLNLYTVPFPDTNTLSLCYQETKQWCLNHWEKMHQNQLLEICNRAQLAIDYIKQTCPHCVSDIQKAFAAVTRILFHTTTSNITQALEHFTPAQCPNLAATMPSCQDIPMGMLGALPTYCWALLEKCTEVCSDLAS